MEDVYRSLAESLDRIPNGFPRTESGAELRLLAKIFTPEEARLASVMGAAFEPVDVIAGRAGLAPDAARALLLQMAGKGMVGSPWGRPPDAFALRPFVVGIYESQLSRMDTEMAALAEQYFEETQGGIVREPPHLHRVLPVEQSIPVEFEIFPYERAVELVENARSWGVRPCICRVQKRLLGKGCSHPVENCLMFAMSLSRFKVPFEMHIYPDGVHGLALAPDLPHVATWFNLCGQWLREIGW